MVCLQKKKDFVFLKQEKIKSAGIDYYLAKPLRPANLLHILNHELTVEERDYVVFDGKELLETLDHDKEAYGELLEMFLHTQKQNLKKVRNALLLSDYEELENILHAMKGTAGSLYCNRSCPGPRRTRYAPHPRDSRRWDSGGSS